MISAKAFQLRELHGSPSVVMLKNTPEEILLRSIMATIRIINRIMQKQKEILWNIRGCAGSRCVRRMEWLLRRSNTQGAVLSHRRWNSYPSVKILVASRHRNM